MEMNPLWAGQIKQWQFALIQYFSHLCFMTTLQEHSTQNFDNLDITKL